MNLCLKKIGLLGVFILASIILSGCEDDDSFPHKPPAGMGSLVVDNRITADVKVYLNGYLLYEVDSYDYEVADLEPGLYRVVIDEKKGDHSDRMDVDIIEGKLTVIQIKGYLDSYSFDTRIYFD